MGKVAGRSASEPVSSLVTYLKKPTLWSNGEGRSRRKERTEAFRRFFRFDILSHAYDLARSNKGAPGIDGVSFESIEAGEGEERFLQKLQEELESRSYRTGAVRRVWIPKPDGSKRPLEALRYVLDRLDLRLNDKKTRMSSHPGDRCSGSRTE